MGLSNYLYWILWHFLKLLSLACWDPYEWLPSIMTVLSVLWSCMNLLRMFLSSLSGMTIKMLWGTAWSLRECYLWPDTPWILQFWPLLFESGHVLMSSHIFMTKWVPYPLSFTLVIWKCWHTALGMCRLQAEIVQNFHIITERKKIFVWIAASTQNKANSLYGTGNVV